MAIAYNIPINIPNEAGARAISLSELKEKVQSYVNSLNITIRPSEAEVETGATHRHSLSNLRGICKSDMTDREAREEYIKEKYQ